jgi:hypothetical protein
MPNKQTQPPKKKPGQTPGTMHIDKRIDQVLDSPDSNGGVDDYLTTRAVAAWLGVSVAWLEISRGRPGGIPFHQYSNRMIAYRRGDVLEWLKSRRRLSTADYNKPTPKKKKSDADERRPEPESRR